MTSSSFRGRLLASSLLMGVALTANHSARAQTPGEGAAAGIAPPPAAAPTPAEDEIVVTGSRIARDTLTANSPIAVITPETLRLSEVSSLEDYIRDLPQATPDLGGQTNNGGDGVAAANLRNLEPKRTLVLIGGRRFPAYNADGVVDLNAIPLSLIKRVEVVTGGASAVYGSDAIAGVINVILDDRFVGIRGDAQYGITERGDARSINAGATAGFAFGGGRGNLVLNAGYTKKASLSQGARSFGASPVLASNLAVTGNQVDIAGLVPELIPGSFGAFCSAPQRNAGACAAQFLPNGNLGPIYRDYNFAPFQLFQAPEERYSLHGLARYELSDAVELFGRASFIDSRVGIQVAPSGLFFSDTQVNLDNPLLTQQARALLTPYGLPNGNARILLGRRTEEVGPRITRFRNRTYQLLGGLRGELGGGLRYEAALQYGKVRRRVLFLNDVNGPRVQQALLARTIGGTVQCVDPSNGCVPANLFTPGAISAGAANFIRLDQRNEERTTQLVANATLSGDLFTIGRAATPVGFAAGVEYRRETGDTRPDATLAAAFGPGFGAVAPVDARYDVTEGYGELRVPLLTDLSFAHLLAFEGGVRYSRYRNRLVGGGRNSFDNWTWKAGGEYAPIEGLRLRGLFQRAVRAPNLTELGEPRTFGRAGISGDPCAGAGPVGNPQLTALCVATGVPTTSIGSVPAPGSGLVNTFSGGNIALRPERSNTWTIGGEIAPGPLAGLSLAVDYFNIDIKNAIVAISQQVIVNACYRQLQDANSIFCQRITRGLGGTLVGAATFGIDASRINAARLKRTGYDIAASYRFDLGPNANATIGITATRASKSIVQTTVTLPANDCAGKVGTICVSPQPRWSFLQTSQLGWGPATLVLRWRHIGKVAQDAIPLQGAPAAAFAVPVIGSQDYLDLAGSIRVSANFELRGGITNLTDKDPPLLGFNYGTPQTNTGNTYPSLYDPLGRRFFMGATVTF